MTSSSRTHTWRGFLWLWATEMLSMTGTGLTTFALGAWIYETTQDTTSFAMLSVAALLPGIILLPFSGALADYLPRAKVMAWCNGIAGASAGALAVLVWRGEANLALIYALLATSALCRALQWVTFTAVMTQMVPPKKLANMSALIYVGEAGQLLAPLIAAPLIAWSGYITPLGADFASFVLAMAAILLVAIPPLPGDDTRPKLLTQLALGWRFIIERPGLIWLQGFFAVSQFLGGFLPILTLPALMEITGSAKETGIAMGLASLGVIAGALWMTFKPITSRQVLFTVIFDALASISLVVLAWGAGLYGASWVSALGFVFLFFHAAESAVSQALWQRKVPEQLQGRVFAIRRAMSWSLVPVCYALAGPLVDSWIPDISAAFTPDRPERLESILLLMAAAGAARALLLAPAALLCGPMMRIEQELPDAITADEF